MRPKNSTSGLGYSKEQASFSKAFAVPVLRGRKA